jgi:hypothetical protein
MWTNHANCNDSISNKLPFGYCDLTFILTTTWCIASDPTGSAPATHQALPTK